MIISKAPAHNDQLIINDQAIERVEKFKYLGAFINLRPKSGPGNPCKD